ncbi:hypothetical protein ES319_D01G137900v1 [Gossypium barbadense]|uniref:Serine/threonine-protein phosphatase 2A 55 kDa regulatory subunit B n=3 Tax=Gossypium TaxID=3633 RepID=A0A5J5SQC0_GOSBA|nr:hypothetical protein ES319_D01G137900v1 [Gossypium barbadense]KAB2045099.1 hypothetical protein ES319_D01G137900v1 [Gossypium barbadense]TYG83199.1 hypothetical protein ES288_D01G150100v1 [Gossypium darwinii]TYH87896.1 hypothetical protein ES332_D01G150600v1 [Gossypium tomentosum]
MSYQPCDSERELLPSTELKEEWKLANAPKNDKFQYTHFVHKISSFDTAPNKLLASDSHLRPDRYALEQGDLSKAGFEKSSDGETFISADDLRINLWNLEISNQTFNIVDVKPVNMEDLTGKPILFWYFSLLLSLLKAYASSVLFNIFAKVMVIVMSIIAKVITSADFHPTHCNMLAYSSSKSSIRLIDLRQSALCDSHAKLQVFYRF